MSGVEDMYTNAYTVPWQNWVCCSCSSEIYNIEEVLLEVHVIHHSVFHNSLWKPTNKIEKPHFSPAVSSWLLLYLEAAVIITFCN